eukprot:g8004.t1
MAIMVNLIDGYESCALMVDGQMEDDKPRFSSMDTPSDSDFDDYYDEVAQDLFSEEMESMKLAYGEEARTGAGNRKER